VHESLKKGFGLGEWEVRPLEGALRGPAGERRVQPKAMDVLLSLAEHAGDVVERDTLVREVWGERAVTDEPLTRAIGELRQALGDVRGEPRYIQTIPKRGYRLLMPAVPRTPDGDAAAPGRAGAAASAMQGADRSGERPGSAAAPRSPAMFRGAALGVVALVAAGLVAWLLAGRRPEPGHVTRAGDRPAVVVLPFLDLSPDAKEGYFADGLAEMLTHVLSKMDGLKVVARTSAFAFRNAADVREIGKALGVDAVLEGSVQRQADTLRITTQLVSAHDGTHLWSGKFDRAPRDVFAIQDEIAAAVAAALHVALLSDAQRRRSVQPTESVEAYDAFLEGRQLLGRRTSGSLGAAVQRFERAVALDPEFALAWVGLADASMLLRYYGNVPLEEVSVRARAAIERALQLDPALGEAYASRGLLHAELKETDEAVTALQRAIALEPNYALAYFWYGTVLNDSGHPAEALDMHRAGLDLDPLAPAINNAVGVALEKLGRFDDALAQFERVIAIDPGYAATRDRVAQLHWTAFARLDEAVRLEREALTVDPGYPISAGLLSELCLDLGADEAAADWIRHAEDVGANVEWAHRARALWLAFRDESPDERLRIASEWTAGARGVDTVEILLRIARDILLERGAPDAAIALYGAQFPSLAGPEPVVGWRTFAAAVDLAQVVKRTGDDARAERLLSGAERIVAEIPRLGCCGYAVADVEIHAIRGDVDAALAALERAVADGWRRHWWWETERNPNLALLHGEPRFRAAVASLRREMETVRARVGEAALAPPAGPGQ
jgi:TolB-like protein/DNA-binding winged helix-turn-helix (wHTH) protein/Tfp pilus assembly protein PilF